MHCTEVHTLLDDYLDGQLELAAREQLIDHLDDCRACEKELHQRRVLRSRLRQLPVDVPPPGYAAGALYRARQQHLQRRHRALLTGFGGALAASLALWAVVAFWQPVTETRGPGIHTITLQVEQVQTINLAFNVPERLDRVRFRLELPPGVALANRPGERAVTWQDRLEPGRNLLRLPLLAKAGAGGELVARIEVNGMQKTFRVPVRTPAPGAWHHPAAQPVRPVQARPSHFYTFHPTYIKGA